jgi:hypothetical protein
MENLTQHNNSTDISKQIILKIIFYYKQIPLKTEYFAELGHLVTSRTTRDLQLRNDPVQAMSVHAGMYGT